MRRRNKIIIGAASAAIIGLLFIIFALPPILKSQAISKVRQTTGRELAVGRIGINPFTWSARIEGVRLSEKGAPATFVSFSSVRASLSPMSIFRGGPVVREISVVKPYVRIVRTGPNAYNFSDLMPKPDPAKKPSEPARFSLNNITIQRGSIDFVDRAVPRETTHTVRNLDVAVPFVSNIPYLAEKYVVPKLHADVNGAPLRLDGRLKPFAKAAEYSVALNLRDLDLPFYASYVPATLPVVIPSGKLSVNLELTHRAVSEGKPDLIAQGTVGLRQLGVDERKGGNLLKLAGVETKIAAARILTGTYDISSVIIDGPEIFVRREADGRVNLLSLGSGGKPAEAPEEPAKEEKKARPAVSVATFRVAKGAVHFTDRVPAGGFSGDLNSIDISADGFGTAAGKVAKFIVASVSGRDEKIGLTGTFSLEPLNLACDLKLADLVIEAYQPYLAAFLTQPLKGRIDAAASASYVPDGGNVRDIELRLRNLAVPFAPNEGVKLALASLKGASFDLKTRQLDVAEVAFKDGSIRLSRDAKGRLSPLALLKEAAPAAAPKKEAPAPAKGSAAPFGGRIRSVTASGLDVGFTDGTKEDLPHFDLRKISFNVGNVTLPKQGTMPFRIAAGYGKGGALSASGTVNPAPLRLKADCRVQRLPIADFEAYFPEELNMSFVDGLIDTALAVDLNQGKETLGGTFRGSVGVRSMYALDADSEDLLRWESLQLENVSGTLAPFSLAISDVALNRFFAKVVFNADGTLNLKQLYTKEPEGKGAVVAAAVTAPPTAMVTAMVTAPPAPAGKPVRIETVTLQDGILVFSDRQTRPEYTTKLVNLGGRVSGLSSEEAKFADVDLRGNLENQSPLRITGKINPLREDLFVDLKVSMTDIELSPMTPYSGTYLGYAVDRGKLFLDLKYNIEKKKLDADNKVFIDQLTFGKGIDSEKATKLPVKLAVALLKDRKGEIHLDLPISGRTNDPQFSVFSVVLQMLKNLLVKAATAPFSLIASAFGGKDDFSNVAFEPGTSRLANGEADKLARLAKALQERPGLKLEVSGFVDRERDSEGYRHELLAKKMRNEKFLVLVKEKKLEQGQVAEAVEVLPEERSRYLKSVYLKEKFPKPRNVLGLVKDLPDEEMRKLFLANVRVVEQDLQALAHERAAVVKGYLTGLGKLEAERVFEKSGDIYKKPEKDGAVSRVEFGVATQ